MMPRTRDLENGQDDDKPTAMSRSRTHMTSIACYECRRRKCKCDGNHPCTNCIRRSTECSFDTVSGSAHTEHLKARIRGLETRNLALEAETERLTRALASITSQTVSQIGVPDPWLSHGQSHSHRHSHSHTQSPISSDFSAASSVQGSQNLSDDHYSPRQDFHHDKRPRAGTASSVPLPRLPPQINTFHGGMSAASTATQPGPFNSFLRDRGKFSNAALEMFVNGHRMALQNGSDPNVILNSGLDVGPLLNATRPMTEWSSWALQLPMVLKGTTLGQKLACAYVTYHQLRWLIFPNQDNYDTIPDFIKPMVAQVFIPHMVYINLFVKSAITVGEATVFDVVEGQNAHSQPNLISNRIKDWDQPMSEATVFHAGSGHTRLTPAFEKFVQNSDNWQPLVADDGNPPLNSFLAPTVVG